MYHKNYTNIIKVLSIFTCFNNLSLIENIEEEIFKQDLGNDMKIGLSNTGYKKVKLKCGSNSMHVHVETDRDFYGVIYTRGSFHERKSPCFIESDGKRGQRSFSMKFPLDDCKTQQSGNIYSNVLILQHDKDLIMPGDAAFNLECDFQKPRNIKVEANMNSKDDSILSRIELTDADPGVKEHKRKERTSVENYNVVEFKLDDIKLDKIELR